MQNTISRKDSRAVITKWDDLKLNVPFTISNSGGIYVKVNLSEYFRFRYNDILLGRDTNFCNVQYVSLEIKEL